MKATKHLMVGLLMASLLVVLSWLNPPAAQAATCTSQATGPWSDPNTWTGCGASSRRPATTWSSPPGIR